MATLINGNGNAAVYAQQDADWFRAIAGGVTQLMPVGNQMAYEIEDANTIAVKDGGIITKEGRRIQIDVGTIDEFLIPTGTQGTTNYFIIGYHLYKDESSNELCDTFVQLMNSATDTIQEDTFRGGATDVYVSLYRVTQDGLNLDTVELLLGTYTTTGDIEDDLGSADISAIGDGTVKGAISGINSNLSENKLEGAIDISSYTSTFYTCPSDGYAYAQDNNNNATIYIQIWGSDELNYTQIIVMSGGCQSVFVKKGMKLKVTMVGGTGRTRFYPLA